MVSSLRKKSEVKTAGDDEDGSGGVNREPQTGGQEAAAFALRFAPDEEGVGEQSREQDAQPDEDEMTGRAGIGELEERRAPAAIAEKKKPGDKERKRAAHDRGRRGNGAIDGGAFHERTDDTEMFFGLGAFVHG